MMGEGTVNDEELGHWWVTTGVETMNGKRIVEETPCEHDKPGPHPMATDEYGVIHCHGVRRRVLPPGQYMRVELDAQRRRTLRIAVAQAIAEQRPPSKRCDPVTPCSYCFVLADAALVAINDEGWNLGRKEAPE